MAMRSSEVKIKRRELMTPHDVAMMLRRMANELEEMGAFLLDRYPVTLAHQVSVRQEYRKEGLSHEFALKLAWEEELADQPNLKGQEGADEHGEEAEELPDPGVPTPPLDLPGPEDRPRMGQSAVVKL
jgi:hypothetical protein